MKKTTSKLKTISNTTKKEGGGVLFTRSDTKGEEQHQGRLKNTRKSTRKAKTTKKNTISNTTKNGGGSIQQERHQRKGASLREKEHEEEHQVTQDQKRKP
jgi:hypothetical protein